MILDKDLLNVSGFQVREMSLFQVRANVIWLEIEVVELDGHDFPGYDLAIIEDVFAFAASVEILEVLLLADRAGRDLAIGIYPHARDEQGKGADHYEKDQLFR